MSPAPLSLSDLLPGASLPDVLVSQRCAHITADSRAVREGSLFFALAGGKTDGVRFAEAAIAGGAMAVVSERRDASKSGRWILVPHARLALARAAAALYPRQPSTIAAVTGTSGKTSVAAFLRQIWLGMGHRAASLGTIGLVGPDDAVYGSLTTPDPVTLHETLEKLAGDHVTHLAMEASSHGLDQFRLDGVRLSAAAFTNLSRDHLDYHASFEDYFQAKLRLFTEVMPPGGVAVVNADDAFAARVIAACRARECRTFTVGAQGEDLTLLGAACADFVTRIKVRHEGHTYEVNLPLAGEFQASNALVAAGLAIATGSEPAMVLHALSALRGAPGRMERVGLHNGGLVLVDYAHKPDALEKALSALRPFVRGKLIVVFGCGGDRDPGKRPLMGEIAQRLADTVIVTDDNPRSENPGAIRQAILKAAPAAIEIGDRRSAIRHGVSLLADGDVLVIAGKGHESGQIIGDYVAPFSDIDEAHAAMEHCAA